MRLVDKIKRGRIVISDGAMGTMLQSRGMPPGVCPEMMNIEMPDMVKSITRDYIRAGARIVETNTFGANGFILEKYGLRDRLAEINGAGVKLAREAVDEAADESADVMVFASLGPAGVFLEPLGNVTKGNLRSAVREQVDALKEAGADGVCVETMTDIDEASITVGAVKDAGMECIGLMCFEASPRGYHTMMGANIEHAVKALIDAGADAVGAGCGVGTSEMVEIAREMRALTDHPLVIHPNAGKPEYRDGCTLYLETPAMFANAALELVSAGVDVVGGCCGTTPEHISAVSEELRSKYPERL